MNVYDVVVVGAGAAGLTAAALLQHDGAHTLCLERHDKVGGCAGYFSLGEREGENGWTFAAGATVALGLEVGGLHRRVFDYLRADTPPAHLLEGLRVVLPDREMLLAHDPARWRQERSRLPGNRIGQELFWRLQALTADAGWRALGRLPSLPLQTAQDWRRNLRLADPRLLPMGAGTLTTADALMRALRIDRDQAFRALVNLQLLITVQEEAHRTPWANAATGLDLWRHGAWHLEGGMGSLCRHLSEAFVRDGGELRLSETAHRITPCEGAFEVETPQGCYRARHVVANVPIWNVDTLVDLPARARRNVTESVRHAGVGWGAVTLYAALRDSEDLRRAPLHHQVLLDYEAQPGDGRDVFLSLSLPDDTQQAPPGWRALTVSTHVRTSEWQGIDPAQYRAQKRAWRSKLLEGVTRALPDFEARRKFVVAGTPRTWEGYTGRAEGTVGGVRVTPQTANFRALAGRIGLRRFHLVGDSVFPGQGTVACALSGINAWRDITGKQGLE